MTFVLPKNCLLHNYSHHFLHYTLMFLCHLITSWPCSLHVSFSDIWPKLPYILLLTDKGHRYDHCSSQHVNQYSHVLFKCPSNPLHWDPCRCQSYYKPEQELMEKNILRIMKSLWLCGLSTYSRVSSWITSSSDPHVELSLGTSIQHTDISRYYNKILFNM